MVILGDFSWFFPKWNFAERWGFLRCNQCIKTLHLSYRTPQYADFHFLPYNGFFLKFFRPLVTGGKHKNFIFRKILSSEKYFQFSYDIRHIKPPRPENVLNIPPPSIIIKSVSLALTGTDNKWSVKALMTTPWGLSTCRPHSSPSHWLWQGWLQMDSGEHCGQIHKL